jgi:hypothetical protein
MLVVSQRFIGLYALVAAVYVGRDLGEPARPQAPRLDHPPGRARTGGRGGPLRRLLVST